MNRRLVGVFILALSQVACAANNVPTELTVQQHPNREGIYLVYYRYNEMIDEYGLGVEKVLERAGQSPDTESKQAIWDEAVATAILQYLETWNLIPKACVNGIVIISSQRNEGGGGTTAFRCK